MDRENQRYLVAAAGAGLLLGALNWMRRNATAYSFDRKVVVIAGGSRGLGLAIARALDAEGARLVLVARDAAELDRAKEQLWGEALTIPCDITDRDQVDAMVRQAVDRFGRIDVLINCAGIIGVGPLETMTIDDFRAAMDVNYWGPLYTCMAAIPVMKEQGEGRIVNVSSIGGKISVPHLLPYSASKFALVGLSHGLRAELAKDNIVVTTVCPGLMRTGSPRNASFKGKHQEEYAWFSIADSNPLTSMNADRAARQIIDACSHGDAEIILTLQAKLAAKADALFPELTTALLAMTNRLLPDAGGIGQESLPGHESESDITRSPATALTQKAEVKNNQRG